MHCWLAYLRDIIHDRLVFITIPGGWHHTSHNSEEVHQMGVQPHDLKTTDFSATTVPPCTVRLIEIRWYLPVYLVRTRGFSYCLPSMAYF